MCTCVCACVCVTGPGPREGADQKQAGGSSQDKQGLFAGELGCVVGGVWRVFEAHSQAAPCLWAGSTRTGLVLVGRGAGRQTPCPGQARLAGWWGREAPGCRWRARAVLHGVINLLTQGWAGTPWRVTRCLAYCQLTNPLTRPEHALLTPRSRTLLTLQLQGLERGWDVGVDEAPAVPAHGPGSLCRPTFRGRASAIGLTCRPLPAGRP